MEGVISKLITFVSVPLNRSRIKVYINRIRIIYNVTRIEKIRSDSINIEILRYVLEILEKNKKEFWFNDILLETLLNINPKYFILRVSVLYYPNKVEIFYIFLSWVEEHAEHDTLKN